MNLAAFVSGSIGAINPHIRLSVRLSAGYATGDDGVQAPQYQTPVAFRGYVTNGILTVTSVSEGYLAPMQTIVGDSIPALTTILRQLGGEPGSVGAYQLSGPTFGPYGPGGMIGVDAIDDFGIGQQLVPDGGAIGVDSIGDFAIGVDTSFDMTASLTLFGQVQPMQYKDLQQVEGLNLNGTRKKIYLYGVVEGIVRSLSKGGSLIYDPYGNVWLVALVIEQWHHDAWCAVAATLQNERTA